MRALVTALLIAIAPAANAVEALTEEQLNIESVTVMASTSLSVALTEISKEYSRRENVDVNTVYNSSGDMVRDIEEGDPADIVITPSKEYFEKMKEEGLLDPNGIAIIASTRLNLVTAKDFKIEKKDKIPDMLRQIHNKALMVIADPETTMLGYATRIALENMHLWPDFEKRVVLAPNAVKTIDLIIKSETAGIVFETEAKLYAEKINNLGIIPTDLHPPINYYAAVVVSGNMTKARKYLQFLSSPAAKDILKTNGFLVK